MATETPIEDFDVTEGPAKALVIPPQSATRRALAGASRITLLLTLVVAVFWQGGVSPSAMWLLLALGGLAWMLSWAVRSAGLPRARFAWLWLALGGYSALQLMPLPRSLVAIIHPQAVVISDLGRLAVGLAPAESLPIVIAWADGAFQTALYLLGGALAMIAAVTTQVEDGRRMMRNLGHVMLWIALVSGGLWLLTHEPHLVRLVPHAVREELRFFTFINPNHETGLLVVGLALALGHAIESRTVRLQTLHGLIAAFLGLTILLIGSRGGVLVGFLVLVLTGATMPRPQQHMRRDEWVRRAEARQRMLLMTLSVVVVLVVLAMPVLEVEFDVIGANSLDNDAKLNAVRKIIPMLGEGWLFGQGPGTLPVVMGMAHSELLSRVDFAENLIAQRLFDGGLWGGLPFLVAFAWLLGSMFRLRRRFQGYTPMWIGVTALALANMVDFSLEIAGGLLLFLALATAAERTWPTRRSPSRRGRPAKLQRMLLPSRLVAGGALALAALLLAGSDGSLTRQVSARLVDAPLSEARTRLADGLLHNHHAYYVVARKMIAKGDMAGAKPLLDRAIALRPASEHARLFRLVVYLELAELEPAVVDLTELLKSWRPVSKRALNACIGSAHAEELLVKVIPRIPDRSYQVGLHIYQRGRPDLVERVALSLRKSFPDRRFNIEGLRGRVYVKRGHFEPARRISAALMAKPETELAGWELEALILSHTGRHYEAHHLLREVCGRWATNWTACTGAINTILSAKRPEMALEYIRAQFSHMRQRTHSAIFYWRSLGRAYLQMRRADDAINAAERVLGYARDDRSALMILVKGKVMIGDSRSAKALLARLQKVYPADKAVMRLANEATATQVKLLPR